MVSKVMSLNPGVDKAVLVLTGATEIRNAFPVDQQHDVIEGYMSGLKVVFAICIAASGIATLIGFGTRWQRLNEAQRSGGGMA